MHESLRISRRLFTAWKPIRYYKLSKDTSGAPSLKLMRCLRNRLCGGTKIQATLVGVVCSSFILNVLSTLMPGPISLICSTLGWRVKQTKICRLR